MRILAHPDPFVLERALIERLEADHPADGVARSTVVVPTQRLADHVQRSVALRSDRAAWLGVDVLTFHALAVSILGEAAVPTPRLASSRLRESGVRRLLGRKRNNPWARFVERRPGTLRRLAGTLNDLREAGVRPADLRSVARDDDRDEALAELYQAYAGWLADGIETGWSDEAGLLEAAVRHAAAHARRCRQIFVHGAYELIGIHVRLLRELALEAPVTVMLPARPGATVTEYAEQFARQHLLGADDAIVALENDGRDGCGLELAALYDETSRPGAAPEGRFTFRHAQGPSAEVQAVVHEALRAVADGCPPDEIAVVARSLEPYAAAIEAGFQDAGLNWTSSLTVPLRRQPLVRDFLLLLRVLAEDFPRRETATLLASRRVRWTALPGVKHLPRGDLAEIWSRRARVLGGLDEWVRTLPLWLETKRGSRAADTDGEGARGLELQARRLIDALQALRRRLPPGERRWSEHARDLRALLDELFDPRDRAETTALAELRVLIDEMAHLEGFVGDRENVPFRKMCAWVREAVQASESTPWREDRGGIRVLDAMQARGLTFERVFVLGMNAGVFPRTPREDPVLGDALRERLREARDTPLPLAAHAADQERLLLALMLGSARRTTEISWQRADDAGRSRSTSLALREVARLAFGEPALGLVRDAALAVPSHPTQWLEYLAAGPRILSRPDTMLLAALQGYGDRALDALGEQFPELRDGVGMLKSTQSFRIANPAFDARIDRSGLGKGLSVSEMEDLGRCPLQFFFADVLRVRKLDDPASAEVLPLADLGSRVHALLELVYVKLAEENRFEAGQGESLLRRAREILDAEREGLLGEAAHRFASRLPLLWKLTGDTWFEALTGFVTRDLQRIVEEGWRPASFEASTERSLDLGEGVRVELHGRLDRRLTDGSRTLVGDYKTSGKLEPKTNPTNMLKAQRLQVPLYAMLAGEGASVELLGVGPRYDPQAGGSRAEFNGFEGDEQQRGFLETLRVLVTLAERGRFPFHSDKHCDWCAYPMACRRKHPPTQHRETVYPDARRFEAIGKKTAKRPLLLEGNASDAAD